MTKAPCILFPYNVVMCNAVFTLKIPVIPGDVKLNLTVHSHWDPYLQIQRLYFGLILQGSSSHGDKGLSQLFAGSPFHGDRDQ